MKQSLGIAGFRLNFRTKGAITIAAGFAAVAISHIMIGQNFDVRNLYNHTGIHPGVAASTVLFLAGGYFLVSGLMKSSKSGRLRLWWLVLQELGARPFRSLTMGAGIAVVVGVIFLSFLVTAGAATSANIASGKAGADIMVVAEGTAIQNDFYQYPFSYSSLLAGSVQEQIASIEGVESVSGQRFLGTVLTGTGGCGALYETYFIEVDPEDSFIGPWLPGEKPLGKGQILGGSNIVPSTLELWEYFSWELEKRASLPLTGTYIDNIVYVTPETTKELITNSTKIAGYVAPPGGIDLQKGLVSAVLVKVSGDGSVDAVADSISEEVKHVTVIKTNELATAASQRLSSLLSSFTYLGSLTVGISIILVSSLSSVTVNEKRREIGVLRAVGASRPFVSKLLASQIVLLSIFGGIAGIVGSALAFYFNYQTIISSLRIPFVPLEFFDFVGIVSFSVLISVACGAAAALYPAYKANKMDPYDAIRRESR